MGKGEGEMSSSAITSWSDEKKGEVMCVWKVEKGGWEWSGYSMADFLSNEKKIFSCDPGCVYPCRLVFVCTSL